ncbi:hypothetical protein [uncultured Clostridium sp.]|uniref:hypothetical protein n=1 Tax=uncultured Clostridium sp. TaxID=59620 RepID=UPI0025EE7227|nr:hypothetical protein [uncultured Clostridium sp.]
MENDNEIKNLLMQILENQTKAEMKIDKLEQKINKNTLLLEKATDNIKLLAEGQETIVNQIGTSSDESNNTLNNRLEVIELATRSISKDVKFIKHKIHETEEDVFDIKDHLKIIR